MNKCLHVTLATGLLLLLASGQSFADSQVKVTMNGAEMPLQKPAVIESGRTLLPMRSVFESFGFQVQWRPEDRSIEAGRDSYTVAMQVGNASALVNGQGAYLDVPPTIVDGSTYVPLRFVAEALGAEVSWNGESRSVAISTAALDKPAVFKDLRLTELLKKRYGKETLSVRDLFYTTDLAIDSQGIYSLEGIEQYSNLKSLNASRNNLTSLEPLTGLVGLSTLNVSDNQIRDLTPIKRVKGLTSLDVTRNKVRDFTPLVDAKSILDLKIRFNDSTDYSALYYVQGRYRSLDVEKSAIEIPKYDTVLLRNSISYETAVGADSKWVPSSRLGKGEMTNEAVQNLLTVESHAKAGSITVLYDALRLLQVNREFALGDTGQRVKETDSGRIWAFNPGGRDTLRVNRGNEISINQTLAYLLNQDYPENGFLLVLNKDGSHRLLNYFGRVRIEKEEDPKKENEYIFVSYPEYYMVDGAAYLFNAESPAAPETGVIKDFSAVRSTSNVLMASKLGSHASFIGVSDANVGMVLQIKYDPTKDMTVPVGSYEAEPGDSRYGIRLLPKALETSTTVLYEAKDSGMILGFVEPNVPAPDFTKLPTFDYRLYTK